VCLARGRPPCSRRPGRRARLCALAARAAGAFLPKYLESTGAIEPNSTAGLAFHLGNMLSAGGARPGGLARRSDDGAARAGGRGRRMRQKGAAGPFGREQLQR
jgi:hypothetical protein